MDAPVLSVSLLCDPHRRHLARYRAQESIDRVTRSRLSPPRYEASVEFEKRYFKSLESGSEGRGDLAICS